MKLLAIVLIYIGVTTASPLKTVYEWNCIEFVEDDSTSHNTTSQDKCDQKEATPYDIKIFEDLLFITTPRLECGNNPSLSTVSNISGQGGYLLQPYPSWEWHVKEDCSGITSVQTIAIDECGRLWMVDTGRIGDKKVCPAEILVFNLRTKELLLRHTFEDHVVNDELLEVYDIETEGADCNEIWLYIADMSKGRHIIFDGSKSWQLENECLMPDPAQLDNEETDGSIWPNGGAVGGYRIPDKFVHNGAVIVWSFHARRGCAISIADAHNSDQLGNNVTWFKSKIKFPSPVGAAVMTKQGIIFARFVSYGTFVCMWLRDTVTWENLIGIGHDQNTIISFTIFSDKNGKEYLAALTDIRSDQQLEKSDCSEIKFRLRIRDIEAITEGTTCAPTTEHFSPVSITEFGFVPIQPRNH